MAVNILRYLLEYSKKSKDGVNKISEGSNLKEYFYFEGSSGRLNYVTKDENKDNSNKFRTLFSQEMIKNNILIPWVAPSFSHREKGLEKKLKDGIDKCAKLSYMKTVFRKYN